MSSNESRRENAPWKKREEKREKERRTKIRHDEESVTNMAGRQATRKVLSGSLICIGWYTSSEPCVQQKANTNWTQPPRRTNKHKHKKVGRRTHQLLERAEEHLGDGEVADLSRHHRQPRPGTVNSSGSRRAQQRDVPHDHLDLIEITAPATRGVSGVGEDLLEQSGPSLSCLLHAAVRKEGTHWW